MLNSKVTYYLKGPAKKEVQEMLQYVMEVVCQGDRGDCSYSAATGSFVLHLVLLAEDRDKHPILKLYEDEEIWIITNSFGRES